MFFLTIIWVCIVQRKIIHRLFKKSDQLYLNIEMAKIENSNDETLIQMLELLGKEIETRRHFREMSFVLKKLHSAQC